MMVKNLSRKNIEKTNEISSPSIGVLIMHACSREKMKKNKNVRAFDRRVFRFDKHT